MEVLLLKSSRPCPLSTWDRGWKMADILALEPLIRKAHANYFCMFGQDSEFYSKNILRATISPCLKTRKFMKWHQFSNYDWVAPVLVVISGTDGHSPGNMTNWYKKDPTIHWHQFLFCPYFRWHCGETGAQSAEQPFRLAQAGLNDLRLEHNQEARSWESR